jgi:hypothetical protein
VKSSLLKLGDREEGPLAETQIAQMFADGRIDRNTPCKPADRGDWKSIEDYLPMLKYGTQLPPPVEIPRVPPMPPPMPTSLPQRVSVVDFDIPFWSVLKIMFNGWRQHSLSSAAFCRRSLSFGSFSRRYSQG